MRSIALLVSAFACVGCQVFFPLEEFAFDAEVTPVDAMVPADAQTDLDLTVPDLDMTLLDQTVPDGPLPDLALPDGPLPDQAIPDAFVAPDSALEPDPDAGSVDFCTCCFDSIANPECEGSPLSVESAELQDALLFCACGDANVAGVCAASCAFCNDGGGFLDVECEDCITNFCFETTDLCAGDPFCAP